MPDTECTAKLLHSKPCNWPSLTKPMQMRFAWLLPLTRLRPHHLSWALHTHRLYAPTQYPIGTTEQFSRKDCKTQPYAMATVYENTPLHTDDSENIRLLEILPNPTEDDDNVIACKNLRRLNEATTEIYCTLIHVGSASSGPPNLTQ